MLENGKKGTFLRGPEDILNGFFLGNDFPFGEVQNVNVLVETTPEAIAKFLPPPIKPLPDPYITFYAMNVTSIWGGGDPNNDYKGQYADEGFLETGISIPGELNGIVGYYFLAIHLNSDMAIYYGRDCWGYHKKLANIKWYYDKDNDDFCCWEERAGIPLLGLYADFNAEPNEPDFLEKFDKIAANHPDHPGCGCNFTIKWENNKHNIGKGKFENLFARKPFVVVECDTSKELSPSKVGRADLKLMWSDKDPWKELPIVRVLGASYDHYDYTMLGDYETVDVPDEKEFASKYAFYGFDYANGHCTHFGI